MACFYKAEWLIKNHLIHKLSIPNHFKENNFDYQNFDIIWIIRRLTKIQKISKKIIFETLILTF